MKKLIFRLFILAMIIGGMIVGINEGFVRMDWDDGDGTRKFRNVPSGIQVSNVGSSHGLCDFNYLDLEGQYTCFNFGLTAQSLSYDLRIITYYEDNFEKDGIMFIPISYFSFLGEDETQKEEFASQNRRYYKFLPSEKIKCYDYKTALLVKKLPILLQYDRLLEAISGKMKEFKLVRDINQDSLQTGNDTAKSYERAVNLDIKKNAEEAYERHIERHMDENGDIVINHEEIEALYGIIDFCKEKDICPILLTTPYTMEYNQIVQENVPWFRAMFRQMIQEIQDRTGVAYYDYAEDVRFWNNYELFKDADHLNPYGAQKLVDILMNETDEKSN